MASPLDTSAELVSRATRPRLQFGRGLLTDASRGWGDYLLVTMPVLAPSIASVDACVTNTIAVRDEGKVRYVGFVVPRVRGYPTASSTHDRWNPRR